ncbi:hypothetical protein ACA910_019259 [Epithemia clementina (nom. ined.)]
MSLLAMLTTTDAENQKYSKKRSFYMEHSKTRNTHKKSSQKQQSRLLELLDVTSTGVEDTSSYETSVLKEEHSFAKEVTSTIKEILLQETDDTSLLSQQEEPAPAQEVENKTESLLDRLGGPDAIDKFTHAFIEEIGKEDKLAHFFVNVPVETIRLHQRQLFQVVFGASGNIHNPAEPAPPSQEKLINFLIVTHSRLFRDLGLDGTHFDLVATCLVKAANNIQMPVDLLSECLTIVGPLRVAFVKGAALAMKEQYKSVTQQKQQSNAKAVLSSSTGEVRLLAPATPPPPSWLIEKLSGMSENDVACQAVSTEKAVKKNSLKQDGVPKEAKAFVIGRWTCELTTRLTVKDQVLASVFLTIPYMYLMQYLHALLVMAFCDRDKLPINASKLIRIIRFPQGVVKPRAQLTQSMFGCLIAQFTQVAKDLLKEDSRRLSNGGKSAMSKLVRQAELNLRGIRRNLVLEHDIVDKGMPPSAEVLDDTESSANTCASNSVLSDWLLNTIQHCIGETGQDDVAMVQLVSATYTICEEGGGLVKQEPHKKIQDLKLGKPASHPVSYSAARPLKEKHLKRFCRHAKSA